jgi:hypothetical protein
MMQAERGFESEEARWRKRCLELLLQLSSVLKFAEPLCGVQQPVFPVPLSPP